jgi:hypothetical protein
MLFPKAVDIDYIYCFFFAGTAWYFTIQYQRNYYHLLVTYSPYYLINLCNLYIL